VPDMVERVALRGAARVVATAFVSSECLVEEIPRKRANSVLTSKGQREKLHLVHDEQHGNNQI